VGGLTRFQQASEAVMALEKHLTDMDALRVVVFSDQAHDVYASGAEAPQFSEVQRALRQITPAGPTDIAPAIDLACRVRHADRKRLILVVSDMATQTFDVSSAAAKLEKTGAALAVVAVTPEMTADIASSQLSQLSEAVGGSLTATSDLRGLADIFGRFVRAHREPTIRQGRFDVELEVAGGDEEFLHAYILCGVTDENSRVVGRIEDDPVLAVRHVGLGRSATLAVPCAPPFEDARALERLLGGIGPWVLGPGVDVRFSGVTVRRAGKISVQVSAFEGDVPMTGLSLTALAMAATQGDVAERAEMHQVSPGTYEAVLAGAGREQWVAVVDDSGRTVWRAAATSGYSDEFRAIGPNWSALKALAGATGGRIIDLTDVSALGEAVRESGSLELWPWLAAASLLLMLTDWGTFRARRV